MKRECAADSNVLPLSPPQHGGDLARASQVFGVPLEQWIDLSTGISPWSWPVPRLPDHVWRRLPPRSDGLVAAAQSFYQSTAELLAVPGSQWAIAQLCPALLELRAIAPGQRVAVPARGYQEHRFAWARAGINCVEYQCIAELAALVNTASTDHAVVITPNNPTAEVCEAGQLQTIAAQLAERKGWTVVDQAFADLAGDPILELGPCGVTLRSLGKFFGLAGLRVGFVAAPKSLREHLQTQLGPWSLAHPARFIAQQALLDRDWHRLQRERVAAKSQVWSQWLERRLGTPVLNAGLFFTVEKASQDCHQIYRCLGSRGVLLRIFEERDGERLLRFGLPETQRPLQWEDWFAGV